MPDVPIGRDEDFNKLWNAATSERCAQCRHYLPPGADFGRGKHAVVDKLAGKLSALCDDCYDEVMHNIVRTREKKGRFEERHRKAKQKRSSVDEDEDEEEDDEEEDEDDAEDEFKNFFKSLAGHAVKTMFKHIDRRLDRLEKRIFRD